MSKSTKNPEDDAKEFQALIQMFKQQMVSRCKPLPDEPDFFTNESTLIDYLRARKYDLDDAVSMLEETVKWRREYKPLQVDCKQCHQKPGFHCIRQIGHDRTGRPVIYACFAQASSSKNHSADTIEHCVQMLENSKKTLKMSATNWIFVFDCTGMTLPCCNPKLGKSVLNIFANYYPERLGYAIIVNHKSIFQSIWKAIKKFLDPVTANKMIFMKKQEDITKGFRDFFDDETSVWLQREIIANKEQPIRDQQLRFWQKNDKHDPRGSPSYVRDYLTGATNDNYLPHPNIIDLASGRLAVDFDVHQTKNEIAKARSAKITEQELKDYEISVCANSDSDPEL